MNKLDRAFRLHVRFIDGLPTGRKFVLSELNLSLAGANLRDVDLRGANLRDANLRDAVMTFADLSGADFKGALMTFANLSDVNLTGSNLIFTNLTGSNLTFANLSDVILKGAKLTGVNLKDAILTGANLKGINLCHALGNNKEIRNMDEGEPLTYSVTYTSDVIQIGCKNHSYRQWANFTDEQIDSMDSLALAFWKENKDSIFKYISENPASPVNKGTV